ncbi:asparagine synthase B [Clostridium sp.]|uniref:asparagine synthase B n=1 Tax=Clostridium sp. TaxID=1506 RepID=UPI001A61C665|nr:asparagine synthase B [Clostridium sp.]MBK5242595.1 asparagine synthase B [Clostridium sp.]
MCGIAAIIGKSFDNDEEPLMKKMLNLMEHRGPDESDIKRTPQCLLGHKRLSIISPEDGIQPIPNESDNAWIICNGEIYNYKQLKKEHLQQHQFLHNSDSEVALHLYEEYGKNCIDYLDGMFAFIISDSRSGQPSVFAARDPLGIKPLYYGQKNGKYYFASELKCLYGIVDEVIEFPPGNYFTLEDGFVPYRTVKTINDQISFCEQYPLDETLKVIRRLVEKAVKKRLMSDVPLGVLLSGGLDSSLIAAIASKYYQGDGPIKSFCIGIKGSPDLTAARHVAKHLGTDHYEYIYTEQDILEAIPKVIYNLESFDPSLVRSAIPTYFVSKLAAEHVKVILSGEGADEIFSGYAYLEDISDELELKRELVRVLGSIHNINLQRLDRLSMANSIEGRVPFLDEELIKYVLHIPAKWKMPKQKDDIISEKWLLRTAFDGTGYIPDDILWRKKEEFSEGSGTKGFLEEKFNECISDLELKTEVSRIYNEEGLEIRSKEELYFYRVFKTFYPHPSILKTVGRWAVN